MMKDIGNQSSPTSERSVDDLHPLQFRVPGRTQGALRLGRASKTWTTDDEGRLYPHLEFLVDGEDLHQRTAQRALNEASKRATERRPMEVAQYDSRRYRKGEYRIQ